LKAREKLEECVQENLLNNYGHPPRPLKRFRNRLFARPELEDLPRSRSNDPAARVSITANPHQKSIEELREK
jgi:hypothetical protein